MDILNQARKNKNELNIQISTKNLKTLEMI